MYYIVHTTHVPHIRHLKEVIEFLSLFFKEKQCIESSRVSVTTKRCVVLKSRQIMRKYRDTCLLQDCSQLPCQRLREVFDFTSKKRQACNVGFLLHCYQPDSRQEWTYIQLSLEHTTCLKGITRRYIIKCTLNIWYSGRRVFEHTEEMEIKQQCVLNDDAELRDYIKI